MKRVLIIDDELDILEILETLITAEFSCEVVTAVCGNEAVEKLSAEKFDLILSDYSMPNGNGAVVFNYNKENKNLPFIFVSGGYLEDYVDISNFYTTNPLNSYINKPVDIDELNLKVNKVFDIGIHVTSEFIHISDYLLLNFEITSVDIYLKLNEEKYIKIKNRDDSSKAEIIRYRQKSEDYFYIKREELKVFLSQVMSQHLITLKNRTITSKNFELCGHSVEILSVSLDFLGLTKESELIIQTSVETCLDLMMNDPNLKKLVDSFLEFKGYKVSHSLMMSSLCYVMANRIGLGKESIHTKLIQACLLHDLAISEENCSILMLSEEQKKTMRSSLLKEIKDHPQKICNLLRENPIFSSDTLNLIRDHHELPNAKGFPRAISEINMSGLSLLFNFCLHCADHFYHEGSSQESNSKLLRKLKERGFDVGHGEKIFKEFEKITLNIP